MKIRILISVLAIAFITIVSNPQSVQAQIWDSCGTDLRGVSSYSREHWGKLFVDIRDTINGISMFNIGTWDGSQWDSVGSGIDGPFYSTAEYNNKLFISGLFKYVNGPWPGWPTPQVNNFTSWDGVQFQSYGVPSGSGTGMRAVYVYNNELYAGFRNVLNINSQTYSSIFRFNDSTFNHVGGGVQGNFKEVMALTEYNGELIVGGKFEMAGSIPLSNIAKWNGIQWSNIGIGINGPVRSLLVDTVNNILYVGGSFTHIFNQNDTIAAPYFAKFDGSQWSAVGNLPLGPGLTMAMYKGYLYIGRSGLPGPSIMKWDGNNWMGVVPSPNGPITCLTVYKDQLYVSGGFNEIGGIPYAGFARYTDTTTVSLPPQMENTDNTFTIHPNPTSGHITLTFSKPLTGNSEIVIYNVKGEVVLRKSVAKMENSMDITLPESMSTGMYMCKVTGKGFEWAKGFVVE